MRPLYKRRLLVACFLCSVAVASAQQPQSAATLTAVPKLVRFAGSFHPPVSQPAGMMGATFAVYSQQEGGTPLWTEDQNVELDANGNYTVLLGAMKNGGMPSELFAAGESRWLQVKFYAPGEVDLPPVLLVSVPYALKAGDADTLGGKPASAFLLAGSSSVVQPEGSSVAGQAAQSANSVSSMTAAAVVPATTTPGYIARFTSTAGALGNSAIYQKGSNIGIGTKTPGATLEVNGTTKFDQGVTFASGQMFPGAASLGPNTFSGAQTIGSGDVSVSNGNLDLPNTTAATAGVINLGGSAFLHQCCNTSSGYTNTFLGRDAGNFSTTGGYNTASGYGALFLNGTGTDNTASGYVALDLNSAGSYNTATGDHALYSNNTGSNNTASGASALYVNLGGSGNTAVGFSAGADSHRTFPSSGSNSTFVGANANATTDNLTNATAIGYNAQVGESNALVLGSGAMVGIGTPTPQYALDVHGTGNFTGAVTVTGLTVGKCVQAGTGGLLTTTASPCGGGGGGGGTVTSVGTGLGLTGGPITTSGTLSIDTTVVPQLDTGNTFTVSQIVQGYLSANTTNMNGNLSAFYGANHSNSSGNPTVSLINYDSTGANDEVLSTEGASFGGTCTIDVSGNLRCSGAVTGVVETSDNRKLEVYAVQSSENWIEDYGSGALVNGAATIDIELQFAQTVTTGAGYHVFLTPNGDCEQLYVTRKGASSFEVHEAKGGKSSVQFDYRIVARRKGFEAERLTDVTATFGKKVQPPAKIKADGATQH